MPSRASAAPGRHPTLYQRPARAGTEPLVSICIPAFNHGEFVEAAVSSALAQTYEPLEVIVVDDRSTDGSYERLAQISDPRLRLHRNPVRLGHAPNRNRSVALARGELIKFLDDDDQLDPNCVTEMAALFATDPSIGLVFSRRSILLENVDTRESRWWLEVNANLHVRFGTLELVNDGRELFRALLEDGLLINWIGEPSAVMVSRTHFERAGGFSPHVRQLMDSDLWCRILPHAKVGFLDAELASYRFGHAAASTVNNATKRGWLDRLWMLDQLAADNEILVAYPRIAEMLRAEHRQAWRTFAKGGRGADGLRVPMATYPPYARHRLKSMLAARLGSAPGR